MVDYLQLMHGYTKDNRVLEVSEISQGLKNLARELKIPVLAAAQLSRAMEARGGKPRLSDLRESGSIEQDADVVLFLHRESEEARENVSCSIAKHRNGPIGETQMHFNGKNVSFFDIDKEK
jgi:replicative DNA helicase